MPSWPTAASSVSSDGQNLGASFVSGNYFDALGARVLLGRALATFDATEPDSSAVVVLSHQAWTRLFDRDPAIVGRRMTINGRPFEIVGVMRPEFVGLNGYPCDLWVPLTMYRTVLRRDLLSDPQPRELWLTGRLRQGVTREHAASALTPLLRRTLDKGDTVIADLEIQATPTPLTTRHAGRALARIHRFRTRPGRGLRQRLERDARPRQRPASRDRRPPVARRQPWARGPPVADRRPAARCWPVSPPSGSPRWCCASAWPSSWPRCHRRSVCWCASYRSTSTSGCSCSPLPSPAEPRCSSLCCPPSRRRACRSLTRCAARLASAFGASRLRSLLVVGQVAVSIVLIVLAATLARNGSAAAATDLGFEPRGVLS